MKKTALLLIMILAFSHQTFAKKYVYEETVSEEAVSEMKVRFNDLRIEKVGEDISITVGIYKDVVIDGVVVTSDRLPSLCVSNTDALITLNAILEGAKVIQKSGKYDDYGYDGAFSLIEATDIATANAFQARVEAEAARALADSSIE